MKIEFDPAKSEKNRAERGLPFDLVAEFDIATALAWEDTRFPYPERRFVAMNHIGDRLYVVCFALIEGGIRVISFRKANDREVRRYEQEAADR